MASRHSRAQNLLLLGKLLDSRDNASPFTLVLDSLEQTCKPLLKEYIRRANIYKIQVVYAAFESHVPLKGVEAGNHIVYKGNVDKLHQMITAALPSPEKKIRSIVIFDNLNLLASEPGVNLSAYLSTLISPLTSLVAACHLDQPLSASARQSPYSPAPLTLLRYLATTVISMHCFSHVLAAKAARDRSIAIPVHGLQEEEEGILQGMGAQDSRGAVIEVEHRRRSGRSVHVLFFMGSVSSTTSTSKVVAAANNSGPELLPLHEHRLFRSNEANVNTEQDSVGEVSFNLGLTDQQRRDRDGVVLPYFDAQNAAGAPGEGGRILYDMGVEDDFDEEEDEI